MTQNANEGIRFRLCSSFSVASTGMKLWKKSADTKHITNAINFSAVLQIFITNYTAAANAEIIFWN